VTAALAYPHDPDATGILDGQVVDAMRCELAHLDRRATAIRAVLSTLEVEESPRAIVMRAPRVSRPSTRKPAPVVEAVPAAIADRILATLADAWEALTTTEIALAIDVPRDDVASELVELLYTGRVVEVAPDTWVGA
jgi:hypothetical protein